MQVILGKDLKVGDVIIKAGYVKFNTRETVADVFRSPRNARIYFDLKPHCGSVNGGEDFYVDYFTPIEIA